MTLSNPDSVAPKVARNSAFSSLGREDNSYSISQEIGITCAFSDLAISSTTLRYLQLSKS